MARKGFVSFIKNKLVIAVEIVVLLTASLVPLMNTQVAHAATLTARKITLGGTSGSPTTGASKAGQTDVTYTVQYTVATTGNIGGLVFDFCTTPIPATSCTAPTGFNTNKATLALANQAGITGNSVDTTNSTANRIILTRTAGSISSGANFVIDFGSSGGSDGITNPSTSCGGSPADKCTFYVRMFTYDTTAKAQGYTSANPSAVGAPIDSGSVAISTANQLTITARVQEVLHFCVGTADANSTNDCADITGTSVDLGVVDSTAVATITSGLAMLRTNALSGAVINYFAEQNTSSGKLKVAGASCSGTSTTDQCFNSAGTTAIPFVAGTEDYGMQVNSVDTSNGLTTNLTADAQYSNTSNYAWDDTGAFDTIASSSTAVDDEMLKLKFAATAAPTTPTGSYTVTATFVATGTF